MTRKESRTNAFMLLFSLYVNDEVVPDSDFILDDGTVIEVDEFCSSLINNTINNIDEIDTRISSFLQGWSLERLPKSSLAILRLSAAQLLYMKDIPISVVISEAVELAKRFGSEKDYVFINGALGSFEKSLEMNENTSNEHE